MSELVHRPLPRLKPNPIPAIHPVPEYLAEGALKARYEATKLGLDVPWMGVVAMAFAHFADFYDCLWRALEPVVGTEAFAAACLELRQTAEQEASQFSPTDVIGRLQQMGYAQAEIDSIRLCNETFSAGNMPYVLMASLARLLLERRDWSGGGTTLSQSVPKQHPPRLELMEFHHADLTVQELYTDIKAVLGLPFVNTDYRAFSRWPSYFTLAWQDFRSLPAQSDYEAAVARVHDRAVELARGLPNPTGLDSQTLRAAAARGDGGGDAVLNVVRLFQWLLPGLAFNVAYFRAQLL